MGERNWPIFRRLMFLSSFMSIGEMKAFFQTSGMIPWSREASLSVVSNLPGMTSGPVALQGLMSFRRSNPPTVLSIGLALG